MSSDQYGPGYGQGAPGYGPGPGGAPGYGPGPGGPGYGPGPNPYGGQPPQLAGYPVKVQFQYPQKLSRGLIFIKGLLAIPHFIVLMVLGFCAYFVTVIAWFAILFTGRYPQGLFNFTSGLIRWQTRVSAYIYLLTDAYPPFTLQDQ